MVRPLGSAMLFIFTGVTAALTASGFSSGARAALEISDSPTQNVSCASGVCVGTAKAAILNVSDLANYLANGDLKVQSGSAARDIVFRKALSWTSASRLTLDAYQSISFVKALSVAGPGALTITTSDGSRGGDFCFSGKGHIEFWDLSSSLIVNGDSYYLVRSLRQLSRGIAKDPSANFALARSFRAPKSTFAQPPINGTFEGSLEGLGNTISHLTINAGPNGGNIGLIAVYSGNLPDAIRDIGLTDVNISGSGSGQNIGTLLGSMIGGEIANSYATGQITSSGTSSVVGGLVGKAVFSNIFVSHSAVAVSATGSGSTAGGLVGQTDACGCDGISQSYATGAVVVGDNGFAGGIAGTNSSFAISNSYATGSITGGDGAAVGGLVGTNDNDPHETSIATLADVYSTGSVSAGSGASVGGLLGQDQSGTITSDAYWDLDTSGVSDPSRGAGNISNDPGITVLTTSQLQSGLPAGFSASIWHEKNSVNGGYPYLRDLAP